MTLTATPSGAAHPGGAAPDGAAAPTDRTGRGRLLPSWPMVVLAAIAYLPLLATAPGRIGADTKAYLYLDPGRMLRRAVSMWDPDVGMGTVTHQNIGYLFPQGLFYWVAQLVGLPDWVAQRLWTGSILFGAGAGVLFLLRTFRWPDRYAFVAALGYLLTPYVLEYEARISAILLPYAGLGWLIGVTVRGLREDGALDAARRSAVPNQAAPEQGTLVTDRPAERLAGRLAERLAGWRWPATFALLVTLIGSINASSLIFILFAPLMWVPFAVWGTREVRLGPALGLCARAVALIVVTSAWWMAGLYTQAGYGLNVLAFTETVKTVASSSQASEVLRGLGNWFFYGEDALGPWIGPAVDYTGTLWVMAVSFAVPILALAAASCLRFGQRAYFVALILLGTTIAVGVYPYESPSPLGTVFRDFAEGSTAGLALRSLPRAVPMVVLGLSVLLAGGLAVLGERYARRERSVAANAHRAPRRVPPVPALAFGGVVVLLMLNLSPLFRGQFIEPLLDRPEEIPGYEQELATALDEAGDDTRVLELPGADFAHYRWGTTLDPVTYGLMDRPALVRELIPYGEAGSVDLLRSLDRRLQEGVGETEALPDLARLMSVGDIVLRSNLAYERFRTPRPRATWDLFTANPPAGLGQPRVFGPPTLEDPGIPYTDEITLGTDTDVIDPPALAAFEVHDPRPIVRTATTDAPLLVSGNGEALVDAAAAGLLTAVIDADRTVLYAGDLAANDDRLRQALDDGAELLVTDTNRLRAERWTGIRENFGFTEQPGVTPLARDANDNRLELFPDADDSSRTVAELHAPGEPAQIATVRATDYGNTFSYGVSDRPVQAIDGDTETAWRVGAFTDPTGEAWQAELANPTTADHVRLVQPRTGPRNRWITRATLTFDGGSPVTVDLTDASRTADGQVVTFSPRTFSTLRINVDATNFGQRRSYDGLSAVGLAEVEIPGPDSTTLTADEVLRLPTDTLTAAGAESIAHRLSFQISRERANPAEPFRSDPESTMARSFTLPTDRTFALTGTARLSAYATDQLLDTLLGPGAAPAVTSSGRLPGDLAARGSSAFDGDASTHWSPGIGEQAGGWLQVTSPTPVRFSSLDLSVVADGRHSVPTRLGITVDGQKVGQVTLPEIPDAPISSETRDSAQQVTVHFPTVTGSSIRLTVEEVREVTSVDTISGAVHSLPVGIAEIGISGIPSVPATNAATIDTGCRPDLLTIDGQPVGLRISGDTAAAEDRRGLSVRTCGQPVALEAGEHVLRTANGAHTGLDLDRLLLASEAGGGAWVTATGDAADALGPDPAAASGAASGGATGPAESAAAAGGSGPTGAPRVTVRSASNTSMTVDVTGAQPGQEFWLVLGQSRSLGWTARVDGQDAGEPRLVDGYANGWRIDPTSQTLTVELAWAPQGIVAKALALSLVTGALCLVIVVVGHRRRRAVPVGLAGSSGPAGAGGPGDADAADPAGAETAGGHSGGHSAAADLPEADPWRVRSPRASPRTATLATLGTGVVAAVLVSPGAGAVVAALTALGLLTTRGRLLLRVGPVLCLTLSALYVLQVQARHDLPANGSWVAAFDRVATLSWLAVLLLAADQVVSLLQDRAQRPSDPPDDADSDPNSGSGSDR